mgnify:CR=1 FL=1
MFATDAQIFFINCLDISATQIFSSRFLVFSFLLKLYPINYPFIRFQLIIQLICFSIKKTLGGKKGT